jgi:hypothetical protein
MRLFVCSFLGDDAQELYRRQFAEPIAASGGLLRGIPPRSAHITYAFMGDVAEISLAAIADAVAAVAARHDAIAIRLDPGAPITGALTTVAPGQAAGSSRPAGDQRPFELCPSKIAVVPATSSSKRSAARR